MPKGSGGDVHGPSGVGTHTHPESDVTGLTTDLARARTTTAVTSSSLADGAAQQTTITLAKGFRIIRLQVDKACRVRLYTNAAAQTADAGRAVGVDPTTGGVLLDYLATGAGTYDLSPMPDGHNTEATPNTTVPVTITNNSGSTGTVTATFTWQKTEG